MYGLILVLRTATRESSWHSATLAPRRRVCPEPPVGEALHLFVLEDGTKGMQIAYEGGRILLGRSHAGGWAFGTAEEFSGIRIVDDEGVVLWEHNALRTAEPEQE